MLTICKPANDHRGNLQLTKFDTKLFKVTIPLIHGAGWNISVLFTDCFSQQEKRVKRDVSLRVVNELQVHPPL